jgi:hypothetical protein
MDERFRFGRKSFALLRHFAGHPQRLLTYDELVAVGEE